MSQDLSDISTASLTGDFIVRCAAQSPRLRRALRESENHDFRCRISPSKRIICDAPVSFRELGLIEKDRLIRKAKCAAYSTMLGKTAQGF